MFTCKRLAPGDNLEDAFAVRIAVFVDEQGFSRENELDDLDRLSHHVVLYDGETPAATGRVFPQGEPGEYHIGRVAALSRYRGTGLGRRLMEELEALARDLGARELVLGAQRQAEGFYLKCGYHSFGEPYLDEHCEHIYMKKAL